MVISDDKCAIPEFPWFGFPSPSESMTQHKWPKHSHTHTAKGPKVLCVCACMHARNHAAIILMGAERDPETRTFHCVNTNDHSHGEKEGGFKELQGLQCKPQRNMLKCNRPLVPVSFKCHCFSILTFCTHSHKGLHWDISWLFSSLIVTTSF